MWKVAAPRLKRIISKVEVERKFNLGPDFASTFLSKDWATPEALRFRVHNNRTDSSFTAVRQPGQIIRDIYYDTQDHQLSHLGLWVRQRHVEVLPLDSSKQKCNQRRETAEKAHSVSATGASQKPRWNAKLRLGGHFNNSQFVEIDGKKNVSDEVLRITDSTTKLENLQMVTDLRTRRSSWEIEQLDDGEGPSTNMEIVVDEVTEAQAGEGESDKSAFAHTIGEVELFEEFMTEGKNNSEHEALRKMLAARRMKELEEFMGEKPGLFATTPSPVGKLSAYYTWKSKHRVFVHALNTVKKIPKTGASRPPPSDRLRLYGLYKQAMEGDVDGVMERPRSGTGIDADELQREKDKWDAWNNQSGLSRTEAKRRYVEALIDTMHRYANTPDALELVGELEFVWNQIKSNSPSSSNSSPKGRSSFAEPQRFQQPLSGTEGPMKVLSPMSEDDAAEHRYRDKQDDDGEGDYVKKGDRWSRKVEQALMRLSAEIAALREQITTGREWRAKKERTIPARIGWVLSLVAKHFAIDIFILAIILIWMRKRKDPRLEDQVRAILRVLREYVRKLLPSR
ncbi:acyl CoA binding protein-domain-containing protein [Xylaria sp. FL0043]|nr:acyl CoA binding protein-domain-containing protein [Xylaria sp. FL0043]